MCRNPEGREKVSRRQFYLRLWRFRGRKEHNWEEIATKPVRSPYDEFLCYKSFRICGQTIQSSLLFQQNGKTPVKSKSKFFMRRHVPTVKAWFVQGRNVHSLWKRSRLSYVTAFWKDSHVCSQLGRQFWWHLTFLFRALRFHEMKIIFVIHAHKQFVTYLLLTHIGHWWRLTERILKVKPNHAT